MLRILFLLFSFFFIPLLTCFTGLQLIALGDYVKSEFNEPFQFEFNVFRYLEYKEYMYLIMFITLLAMISIFWTTVFSRRARERYKIKHLTLDEKRNYSHLAKTHEAKKGTQRIEFNRKGQSLDNDTIRGFFDVVFDNPKRLYNKIITKLKLSDVHKLNTLTNYKIEGNKSGKRAGLPIITKRNKVWVESGDINTIGVGSTRSGKTYGIIHILIQLLRMCKESMMIMDVKGELYLKHAESLRRDGYDVFRVDFIYPKKSVKWNPLGVIVKKYRKAYNDWLELMKKEENALKTKVIATKTLVLREVQNQLKDVQAQNKKNSLLVKEKILKAELEDLIDNLPKPDYSKAKEYSLDIAMTLCMDESKDPFWPSSAATLLDGYINFLLEEKIDDGNGGWKWLPDKMINMYSVKMLHDLGKTPLNPKQYDGCDNVLQYYIKHYRNIDDTSSMKLKAYLDAPDNTEGSISSVFDDKIKYFLANENILSMTSESEFELTQMGDKKTAVFVCVHDEKSTFHSLASILFSQIYEELIEEARDVAERTKTDIQRLKRSIMVVWDEFANGARWDNITNALAAGLSRGIRYMLIIQDYAQLDNLYGQKANTIKANCLNTTFLLANDNKTLDEVSSRCGKGLRWDRNKNDKIQYDVVPKDRLMKLSLGEVVQIRARKNPYISRLLGFDDYCFVKNLPKTPHDEDRVLENVQKFNILKAWQKRIEGDDKLQIEMNKPTKPVNKHRNLSNSSKDLEKNKNVINTLNELRHTTKNNQNQSLDNDISNLKKSTSNIRKEMLNKFKDTYFNLAEVNINI